MGQNFDHVHPEDRSFTLGGEDFHWRPIWWRDFGAMIDESIAEATRQEREAKRKEDEAKARGEEPPEDDTSIVESYEEVIDRIVKYLEPDEVDRFRALVDNREKQISHLQLMMLRDWLQEVTNKRPTELPSPSGAGRGSGAPTLQAV